MTLTARDAVEKCGILPAVSSDEPTVGVEILEGEGYKLITLVNTSAVRMTNSATLTVRFPFDTVELKSFDGKGTLAKNGNKITVTDFTDGGILVLR